jgi:hypothetical protein
MNIGLYWFKSNHDKTEVSIAHCLLLFIPFVVGIFVIVFSAAIARWVDELLDN